MIRDFGFHQLEVGDVYNDWIFSIIKPFLSDRILEVGCGIGTTIKYYLDKSLVILSDIEESYLRYFRKKVAGKKQFKLLKLDIENISWEKIKSLRTRRIETVIAINVLEHIQKDEMALININRLLQNKGRIILFVPAIPQIYGSLDESFGHFRRYTKEEIVTKLKKANFQIEYFRYFNLIGIFWWFIAGRIIKKRNLPRLTGRMLKIIVPIIQRLENIFSIPIGQSIIIVGRKYS